ncbi:MAG: holo-ACP synthase [Brevinemataceae bacterium]
MITGLGIDIIEVNRIERFVSGKHKQSLLRIFTELEYEYAFGSCNCFERLAVRFAAKEAFFKALGFGILSEIEIRHNSNKQPFFYLHGETHKKWKELNSPQILLSVSHTKLYATASVVVQKAEY